MTKNLNPKLSDAHIADAIAAIEGGGISKTQVAKNLGVARSSLNTAIARYERERTAAVEPGIQTHDDGGLTVTGIPSVGGITLTPDNLLRKYGIDPDEVMIVRDRLNVWGNDDKPNFQLRLDVIPKNLLVLPDPDRPRLPTPEPLNLAPGEAMRWCYMSDHHAPFIDFGLHQTSLQWLRDTQPHLIIIGGDLLNNQKWQRHRERPRFVEAANAGINVGGSILEDIRKAVPNAKIIWLPGNHDQWIEQRMIEDRNQALGVRGYRDDYDVMDLRRLLDTDNVSVEYIDEDWDLAFYPITKNFAAAHGGGTGKNAADAAFAQLLGSLIHGHSHRGKMTYRTRHDPVTGRIECHVAIEAMMMARHGEGKALGYASTPDWMQGFFYGCAWEDDEMFTASPAPYIDRADGGYLLLPDGSRYKADVNKIGEPV